MIFAIQGFFQYLPFFRIYDSEKMRLFPSTSALRLSLPVVTPLADASGPEISAMPEPTR